MPNSGRPENGRPLQLADVAGIRPGRYDEEVNAELSESERRRGYQGLYAEALVKA